MKSHLIFIISLFATLIIGSYINLLFIAGWHGVIVVFCVEYLYVLAFVFMLLLLVSTTYWIRGGRKHFFKILYFVIITATFILVGGSALITDGGRGHFNSGIYPI